MTEEKATLTQRRAMSGAAKLDRSKLRGVSGGSETEEKGSAAKVFIAVLIVLILAAGAFLAYDRLIRNRDTGETTSETTPTPTPLPTSNPTEDILSSEVLADTDALGLQAASKFLVGDQAVGEASEDAFTVESLMLQPYESFMRVEFLVSSDGEQPFPETTAVYSSDEQTITISMNNVIEDKSELGYNETAEIPSSVVDSISHEAQSGTTEVYVITLEEETPFVLHELTQALENRIVLDIRELEEETDPENPDTTPTASPTATPTSAVTEPAGINLTNDFSKNKQFITTSTTGPNVGIGGYLYKDEVAIFKYYLILKGGGDPYPNATATLEGNTLTLEIENLAYDALPDSSGQGMTDFAARGVRDINTVDITFANNKSTYVFELDKPLDYRIYIDEDNNRLNLEFRH
ncbi:MAG: hypothetical protein TR69_WS6001000444 [candidate division WS6 bacterium OLB20]|uniref:Uncharacterized protein n=1 Tax=candidate division WS6 bacterium OLB20 TaxID=1617426 RepID=A0A136LXR2_9BACT|nr:MAG: hypothetical protein TR69_WS6001000444 [candidate division WS6 bacterium OLB20]